MVASMSESILIGNSHLIAVVKAFHPDLDDVGAFGNFHNKGLMLRGEVKADSQSFTYSIFNASEYAPLGALSGRAVVVSSKFGELISTLCDHPKFIFSSLKGSEHSVVSMINMPVRWDFMYGAMDIDENKALIAYEDAVEVCKSRQLETILALRALKLMRPNAKVFHIAPPPPIPSSEWIASNPEIFGDLIAEFGLASPEFRLKVYSIFLDVLERELATFDVNLIRPPLAGVDDAGFLKREFWSGATHANEGYGELVKEQILSQVNA